MVQSFEDRMSSRCGELGDAGLPGGDLVFSQTIKVRSDQPGSFSSTATSSHMILEHIL